MAIEDRIVLVTGASSGIGQSCAEALAGRSFTVYGTSRHSDFQSSLFNTLQLDVTDEDSVKRAVDYVHQRHGRLDCLINSAGYGLAGAIEDTSLEEARHQLDTNFFGVVRVCNAVLPLMRQQRSGLVLNISSLGGLFGLPFQGFYSASKFALEGFSESLRLEARAFGVRVVLIEPGDVATMITKNRVFAAAANSGSAYAEKFCRALAVIEKEEAGGIAAQKIAELVVRIVSGRSSQFRYTVGHFEQRLSAWIKRLGPWPVFEQIMVSFYGIADGASNNSPKTRLSNQSPNSN